MKKILMTVLCGISSINYAQNTDLGVTTQTNQGVRRVVSTQKMGINPVPADTTLPFVATKHPLIPVQHKVAFTPQPIKPAKLKVVDPLDKLYNGYIKAGMGMYTAPFLDAWYTTGRDKTKMLSANVYHFSSWDGLKHHRFARFNDSRLRLNGRFQLKKFVLEGNAAGSLNGVNFYALPDSLGYDKNYVKQLFTGIGTQWTIGSYFNDSTKINYKAGVAYNYFGDLNDKKNKIKFDYGREHQIALTGNFFKYLGREKFSLDAGLDVNIFNSYAQDTCLYCKVTPAGDAWSNGILTLKPSVSTTGKWYHVEAGLAVFADMPQYLDNNLKFYVWPDIELRMNFFNYILVPYFGIDGSLQRNNYRSLATENPYVLSGIALENTANKLRVYGGMKGTLSSKITFNFGASTGIVARMPLYITDTTYSLNNRFYVKYDTITRTLLSGELAYFIGEKLRVEAYGKWFFYSANTEQRAWNLPQYHFGTKAMYNLGNKIIASIEASVIGRRYAKRYDFEVPPAGDENYVLRLKDFTDVNLNIEYRYTKRLSGYLRLNNLVHQQYQLWLEYPAWGINVHGGVTYRF